LFHFEKQFLFSEQRLVVGTKKCRVGRLRKGKSVNGRIRGVNCWGLGANCFGVFWRKYFYLCKKNSRMHTEEIVETTLSDYEIERDKPMPSKHHAFIQGRLFSQFDRHYPDRYTVLPELSLDLPVRDRVPDLCVYPFMESLGEEEIKMTETPLGIVEILSPTQNHIDLNEKRKQYFAAGVQSYWLVLPDLKSVHVFRNVDDHDYFNRHDVLKDKVLGVEIDLKEVFK
jgi:Uma2 family endonuclease